MGVFPTKPALRLPAAALGPAAAVRGAQRQRAAGDEGRRGEGPLASPPNPPPRPRLLTTRSSWRWRRSGTGGWAGLGWARRGSQWQRRRRRRAGGCGESAAGRGHGDTASPHGPGRRCCWPLSVVRGSPNPRERPRLQCPSHLSPHTQRPPPGSVPLCSPRGPRWHRARTDSINVVTALAGEILSALCPVLCQKSSIPWQICAACHTCAQWKC